MRGTPRTSLLVATVIGLVLELLYLLGAAYVFTTLAGLSRSLDTVEGGEAGAGVLLHVGAAVPVLLIAATLVSLAAAARHKGLPRMLAPRTLLRLVVLVNAPVALLALVRGDVLTGGLLAVVGGLSLLAARSPRGDAPRGPGLTSP